VESRGAEFFFLFKSTTRRAVDDRPPAMTRNCRRRAGVAVSGAMGRVAKAASNTSPIDQVRCAIPAAAAGVVRGTRTHGTDCSARHLEAHGVGVLFPASC
jgi:hypothetical protein